jgi:linoleoyl-CoA desaturase
VRLHHNYPNLAGWDSDIEKSDFLKVHPKDKSRRGSPLKKLIVFLYPLFVISWFLIRDFRDYFSRTIVRKLGEIPFIEYCKLIFFKFLYLVLMIGLPIWVTPFSVVQVLLAWFVLMITTGFLGLMILLPPHVNTYNRFPEVDETAGVGHSWLFHQLVTTNDVSMHNWFSRYLMANFNYHLIHHLFPKLSHVYAHEATVVLRRYCIENKLPYRSLPLFTAIGAHFRLIFRNQIDFDIFEEDM